MDGVHTYLDTPNSGSRTVTPLGTWGRLNANIWMWKWEGLACIISISAMVILLVGASKYQSSKLVNWPYLVNVNSVVSWCVMISKMCMLFSVAGCINQLKWRWFQSKNSLAEIILTKPAGDLGEHLLYCFIFANYKFCSRSTIRKR